MNNIVINLNDKRCGSTRCCLLLTVAILSVVNIQGWSFPPITPPEQITERAIPPSLYGARSFLSRSPSILLSASTTPSATDKIISEKEVFISSLDRSNAFNQPTKVRTQYLNSMIPSNPTPKPGSVSSFQSIAPGKWQIVYAPHISTLSGLVGGKFDPVTYDLKENGVIISHAKYSFPVIGEGYLSVSGTYGSVDDNIRCVVDFDRAWIVIGDDYVSDKPIDSFDDVPDTWYKGIINSIGRTFFIKDFAQFPVSYLDDDTIVFDFELSGTKICARKI